MNEGNEVALLFHLCPANVPQELCWPVAGLSASPTDKGLPSLANDASRRNLSSQDAHRRRSPTAQSNLARQGRNLVKPRLQLRKDNIPGILFLDQAPSLPRPGRRTFRIAKHPTDCGGNLCITLRQDDVLTCQIQPFR